MGVRSSNVNSLTSHPKTMKIKTKMMIRREAFLFMWLTICVSGCTFLRGMVNPDYHTQRYKSHVYVKHDKLPMENCVLRGESSGIPYGDHPDLFQDGVNPSPNDGLVNVSVIARPADESPQRASPFILQLSETAQQAVVQSFGQLQGDRKNLLGLLQTLRERTEGGKGSRVPLFDLVQKVEFDIATTLNSGTDADRLDYVTTYVALDNDSAGYFSFIDIQDVEREAQELVIGEISKSTTAGGKLNFQGGAMPAGTPSAEVSANVTESFKKEFRQRFMARTVSIDGKKKYFRVTQRATQEHPIEGLKRYVLTLGVKPALFKDSLFTPVLTNTDPGRLLGVIRTDLYVPERLRADATAVTVSVVRRVTKGDETRVEYDDAVEGLVLLKQQEIRGVWRYPVTLYRLEMSKAGCWEVFNAVPVLEVKRSTGEVVTVTFGSLAEAMAFRKFLLDNAPESGDPPRLEELNAEGRGTGAIYDFGFPEEFGRLSMRRIPQRDRSECLKSILPRLHRASLLD